MANKIIGRTDTSGAVNLGSITSNSKRPVLVIGEGVDDTKEITFKVRGTSDAATHFGTDSQCNDIIKALIKNGVKVIHGMCIGDVGEEHEVTKEITQEVTRTRTVTRTVKADKDGNPILDEDGNYIFVDEDGISLVDVVDDGPIIGDSDNSEPVIGGVTNPDDEDVDEDDEEYTTTVEIDEEYTETVTTTETVKELVGGIYASKAEAYEAAFRQSLTDGEVMVIVLDTTDKVVFKKLAEHLAEAENSDIYRYGVVGVPADMTDIDEVIAIASYVNSDRMFMGFPNVVDDNNIVLDGTLTAAGIASILNTQTDDPALPTNNLTMAGFGGVASQITEDTMNELIDAGIVPVFPEDSVPAIWRMVTTAQKSSGEEAIESIWHDATTRLIADHVLATVLAKLKANYKRTKNVARVLDSIRTDIVSILERMLALEIIEEYDQELVTVVKDPEDRYGALADFEYKVVSPLYTITVTQHIKI